MKTPYITKGQATYKVKELQKLVIRCDNESLKRHFERQLQEAKRIAKTMIANDSALKPPRTPFSKLPKTNYEVYGQ